MHCALESDSLGRLTCYHIGRGDVSICSICIRVEFVVMNCRCAMCMLTLGLLHRVGTYAMAAEPAPAFPDYCVLFHPPLHCYNLLYVL